MKLLDEIEKYFEDLDAPGKEDKDIDNDGDQDASDEYLAKRRNAISKSIKNEVNQTSNMDGGEGPVKTPHMFSKTGEEDEKDNADGWKKIPKTNKIFKPMEGKSTFKKMMAEMYGIGPSINEAQKYDIIAAIRTIKDFNRGNLPDEEYLAKQVVRDLGFRTTRKNIDAAKEHLMMSYDEDKDRVPEDVTMVKELYPILNKLDEAVSYREYKKDPTSTPQQKVNRGINEVNRMLGSMEKIVNNNLRLKTEMGVNSSHFWKNTGKRFSKINERIIRIANRLKELSQ